MPPHPDPDVTPTAGVDVELSPPPAPPADEDAPFDWEVEELSLPFSVTAVPAPLPVETPLLPPPAFPRDVNALSINASPFSWLGCSAFTLISKLTIVPFCVVPFKTAAGCACPDAGALPAGTGIIPSADSPGSDDDGSAIGTTGAENVFVLVASAEAEPRAEAAEVLEGAPVVAGLAGVICPCPEVLADIGGTTAGGTEARADDDDEA